MALSEITTSRVDHHKNASKIVVYRGITSSPSMAKRGISESIDTAASFSQRIRSREAKTSKKNCFYVHVQIKKQAAHAAAKGGGEQNVR